MEFTARNILIGCSSVLGIAAILSFLQTNLFNSPVTTSVVVLAIGIGILLFTYTLQDKPMTIAGTILSAVAIVSSVLYTVVQLASGSLVLTVALTILSTAFLIVAYILQSDEKLDMIDPTHLKIVFVIILILAVGTVAVDITMANPQTNVTVYDTIMTSQAEEPYRSKYVVGTVSITNPSILPQSISHNSLPAQQACLTGINATSLTDEPQEQEAFKQELQNVHLSYDQPYKPFFGTHTSELRFPDHLARILAQNGYTVTDIQIQTANSCPEQTEQPTVTVIKNSGKIIVETPV